MVCTNRWVVEIETPHTQSIFTDHCFTGEYPIKPLDAYDKEFVDNQISFMSSKS